MKSKVASSLTQNGNGTVNTTVTGPAPKFEPTWIHEIFQGTFTSETRCLNCETVTLILSLLFIVYKIKLGETVAH